MIDLFAQVAALPGVGDAVADSRAAVDSLLAHRILRRRSAEVSTESALRGARASAELEGSSIPLVTIREGIITDPIVQGALRVSAELGALAGIWRRAPRQVLARLHVLGAAGIVDSDELGRPRATCEMRTPVELGPPPAPAEVAVRLDTLTSLLARRTEAPALVVGAIVHGELLALRPFGSCDGIVARAAQRVTFAERGLDPKSLVAPEVGHAELGDAYLKALDGYVTGTPVGVAHWVQHCANAVSLAVRDSLAVCEAMYRG